MKLLSGGIIHGVYVWGGGWGVGVGGSEGGGILSMGGTAKCGWNIDIGSCSKSKIVAGKFLLKSTKYNKCTIIAIQNLKNILSCRCLLLILE